MKDLLEKIKPLLAYVLAGVVAAGLVKGGDLLNAPNFSKDVCQKVNESAK